MKTITMQFRLFFAILFTWLCPRSLYLEPLAGDDNTVNHYVNKFDDDVKLAFQQKSSRLEGTVIADYGITGYAKSFDTLGTADMDPVETRNEDIKHKNLDAGRRWIDLGDFDWADYADSFDNLKVLENPVNKYLTAGMAATNRRKDKTIIDAALGNARSTTGYGRNIVSALNALPAEQKILHGGTNISLAKIRTGVEILDAKEVGTEDGDMRVFVHTANQLNVLLADNTLTSSDYNSVQSLVDGKVNHFLGLEWKRVESLPKDAAGIRSNIVYAKSAMGLGMGENVTTDVSQRKDKRGLPWQVYIKISLGAVRGFDVGVVEIQCKE